ncbi:MAG: aminoacyl-histidine dipeptidase [Lachnospiraceae bacterium]|nr:aminoacyl-histidine dipeptidase [Lachnospiraceae bacterium]
MLEMIDNTKVFDYFEEISKVPRGSGNNKAISDYLVEFAKQHGLEYRQDACENVIIRKKASAGLEDKSGVILQGHMDMVCEKDNETCHDFTQEPLDLQKEGDFIFAKGTTLGGDDGIALAYGLAILADDSLVHPPLEMVFTTDEETGMYGAIGLDASVLNGKYLINIDSEEEGTLLTSCAGGMSVNGVFSDDKKEKTGDILSLTISGLKGGHSGTEIEKNRENATLLAARILNGLEVRKIPFCIISIEGGQKDNAIPRETTVEIMVEDKNAVSEMIDEINSLLNREIQFQEPDFQVKIGWKEKERAMVYSEEFTKKLLFFFNHVPNGVQKMSSAINGLVESSLNLGICHTNEEGVFVSFSLRSSLQTYKEYMCEQLKELIELLDGKFSKKSEYPAWEYRADSRLREVMIKVFKEQYDKEPKIEAIHAGLECGILSGKKPELDIVSMGPNILDIHTPKERLSISSVQRVYKYLLEVLRTISDVLPE